MGPELTTGMLPQEAYAVMCVDRVYCFVTFIRLKTRFDPERAFVDVEAVFLARGFRPLTHWSRIFSSVETYGINSGGGRIVADLLGGAVIP